MKKGDIIVCPKCKGKGVVHDKALGVFTLGLTALLECLDDNLKIDCERCGGSGFVKIKTE